jgi:hypothetical protein
MTTFEKLAIRIERDCGIQLVNFRRTYVGFWQKGNGAYVWTANYKDSVHEVGSCETATDLLKSKAPLQTIPPSDRGHLREIISYLS